MNERQPFIILKRRVKKISPPSSSYGDRHEPEYKKRSAKSLLTVRALHKLYWSYSVTFALRLPRYHRVSVKGQVLNDRLSFKTMRRENKDQSTSNNVKYGDIKEISVA